MFTLFLDTASKDHKAALCSEEKTLATTELKTHGDSSLVPAIEKLLSDASLTYNDLTHLACVIGPGGFTSLRVGVATINTLAYALKLPSAGVHLSDLWKARINEKVKMNSTSLKLQGAGNEQWYWLHSTRKTQLFVQGESYKEPTLISLEEAASLEGQYVGELIEEHKEALTNLTPLNESNITPVEETLPQLLSSIEYQSQQLGPWYGRDS